MVLDLWSTLQSTTLFGKQKKNLLSPLLIIAITTNTHYTHNTQPTNFLFGCPGAQFVDFSGCCCGMSAYVCRLMRLCFALILLPLPFALGICLFILGSLLWLPIGITWSLIGLSQPHLLRCFGGPWRHKDLIFPLFAASRHFRQGHGPLSFCYVFLFMGATPLVLGIACLLTIAWFPIAAFVCISRLIQRRPVRLSFLFAPLVGATSFLDLDGG